MKRLLYASAAVLMLATAYHFGAGQASALSFPPEVAVLSGSVPDGGTIPLPHYADGTQALEGECKWIASIQAANASVSSGAYCYTTGRVVSVGANGVCPCGPGIAAYMIIATRVTAPVTTARSTFGEVKARYR
jgi:hypothetical protein